MDFKEKIWILDGAMGTMIPQGGNRDMMNLVSPELIEGIHRQYLEAGADIITTNTFNSNRISQKDYGTQERVREMNLEGARIASRAIASFKTDRKLYVAGSMGPTNKMLSLSPDVNRPQYRPYSFDEMAETYKEQAQGLIDGGADILLVETVFDALNAKAALYAIRQIDKNFPVILSASIADRSGRLLSGHTISALYTAVERYDNIIAFGLNCSFGAKELLPYIARIAEEVSTAVSIYPNAGLPNELGAYDETPKFTAECIGEMARRSLVNIVGGCCGTTPEHIRAIARTVKQYKPRLTPQTKKNPSATLLLSGLETLAVDREHNFVNIGERTNVAGSAKFAKLIEASDYSAAASVAKNQIDGGATIIDINTDTPLLDGAVVMSDFLKVISNDPDIAKVPYMIDSSSWNTLVSGLKCCAGKCIANSISLKDGETEFLRRAEELFELGAAVVVMAFDEQGQATTYQRKIDICARAYNLLTRKVGFDPEDIIFDVNILTVATGIKEHNAYALDFINAVRWIKENLPGCKTSGGVSNLSFAFRGNNTVREALHTVFLYHAIAAGLDMAILNPSLLQVYDEIEPGLLKAAESVVLNTSEDATELLAAISVGFKNSQKGLPDTEASALEWRSEPLESRLEYTLIKGNADYLEIDLKEALLQYKNAVEIIEGPLMSAMDRVGALFEEGKMFLPQVVKSAKAMKMAVELLHPYLNSSNNAADTANRGRVLLATVKGDVHDIGKNIVNIVLSCNGFEVIDLGEMVDNQTILERAVSLKADIIGVSGLITPSLEQMEKLCRLLYESECAIPVIVGGATTSALHTAVKLSPIFKDERFCVVYGGDASRTAGICKRLIDKNLSSEYIKSVHEQQRSMLENYLNRKNDYLTVEQARVYAPSFTSESFIQPNGYGENNLFVKSLNIGEIAGMIDWTAFLNFWGFKGTYPSIIYSETEEGAEAEKLYEQALQMLGEVIAAGEFEASGILNFYDAHSENEEIVLNTGLRLKMPRQTKQGSEYLSLADYLPKAPSYSEIAFFALKVEDLRAGKLDHKGFEYLLRHSLCARLTEALAQWMTERVIEGQHFIRPAFGYPVCPNHSLKKPILELLEAESRVGISMTDSFALIPETALCGMLIAHPQAKYFDLL